MTQLSYATDQRAMNVAKTLAGLAIVAALIAAVAGVVLLIADPDSGSTLRVDARCHRGRRRAQHGGIRHCGAHLCAGQEPVAVTLRPGSGPQPGRCWPPHAVFNIIRSITQS